MEKSARKRAIRRGPYLAKSVKASRLRQRKYALVRKFDLREDALGGSLRCIKRKCGKLTCRCASGEGHPMWTLTYSVAGKRHVEFIPNDLVPTLRPLAEDGDAYLDAVRELLSINAQLVTLWREQEREQRKKKGHRKKIQRRTIRR